jgi:hypothetical protein
MTKERSDSAIIADAFNKAADLIEPKGAWTQYCFARNASGQGTDYRHEEATCWCVLGAVCRALRDEDVDVNDSARKTLDAVAVMKGYPYTSTFNDSHDTTQADAVAFLREAAGAVEQLGDCAGRTDAQEPR